MEIITEIVSDVSVIENSRPVNLNKIGNIVTDINFHMSKFLDSEIKKLCSDNDSLKLKNKSDLIKCKEKSDIVESLYDDREKEKIKKDLILNITNVVEGYQLEKDNLDKLIVFINNINCYDIDELTSQNERILDLIRSEMIK